MRQGPLIRRRSLADLTIPKDHQPILNKIRTLPEESLRGLVTAFSRSPEAIPSIQGLPPDDAEAIQEVVLELYRVRDSLDMEVPEFVSDVALALQEVEAFPGTDLIAFEQRLSKLLTIESVAVATKAASLKMEYERRFCSARMLTDARLIYGVDPSEPP